MTQLAVLHPHPMPANRSTLSPRARRILEVVTPLLAWLLITAPVWGTLLAPALWGYALVLFSAYWLMKSVELGGGVLFGAARLRASKRRDWLAHGAQLPGYDDLQHVVLLPTYRESDEILAETLHHLAVQTLPRDRISVVLAFEERDPDGPARAERLCQRFSSVFRDLLVTRHPDLPGEVKGKSSNLAWAAQQVQREWIETGHLDPDRVLVTVLDADSRLHPSYLAALGYEALHHRNGLYRVYQPAMLFYANHSRLPVPMRAVNTIFSLWEIARMLAIWKLVPQSTYSMSWLVAHGVGYWDVDVIPEDSHMFFKVQFHVGRRTRVQPIFLPVYADAAEGVGFRGTLENHYQQIRRWAWGVSDVPWVIASALKAHDLPWHWRVLRTFWYVEDHVMWPAAWFLVTLGGLAERVLNPGYVASALGVWQTSLSSLLFSLCLPATVIVLLVDWRLRPRGPEEDLLDTLLGLASFVLLPVSTLVLSTLPALDAHTRLLLGKHLEYRVTEKVTAQSARAEESSSAAAGRRALAGFPLNRPQYQRPHAQPSTTPVADTILLMYRDLR